MARAFEFLLDRFVAIEFAVNNDSRLFVLAGDWLIASCKVNDAEARMTKRNLAIRRNPVALSVGAAMVKTLGGLLHHRRRDWTTARKHCNNSTHECFPLVPLIFVWRKL